jgi:threonyl-tRNA synthetase
MHFIVVPNIPAVEAYTCEIAEELASNDCDVEINLAYQISLNWRLVAETDNVITISKKDKQNNTVTVFYRPERKYTTHDRDEFILNWRYLMD